MKKRGKSERKLSFSEIFLKVNYLQRGKKEKR